MSIDDTNKYFNNEHSKLSVRLTEVGKTKIKAILNTKRVSECIGNGVNNNTTGKKQQKREKRVSRCMNASHCAMTKLKRQANRFNKQREY